MTCVRLLPLSTLGVQTDREGRVGAIAFSNSAFIGFHFADGRQYTNFPGSTAIQNRTKTFQGTVKPSNFTKGFGVNYKKCA